MATNTHLQPNPANCFIVFPTAVRSSPTAIRMIEINTGRSPHALEHYEGRTLDDVWREQLLYGATNVTAGDTGHEGRLSVHVWHATCEIRDVCHCNVPLQPYPSSP